jgi:hypothetical protein
MQNDISLKNFKRDIFKYISLLAFVAFLIYVIYMHLTVEKRNIKYYFKGVAEKVTYDDKGDLIVTVKGKLYDLTSTNWNFNYLIKKGDTIEKDSGNLVVKLIKHGNGNVIILNGKY